MNDSKSLPTEGVLFIRETRHFNESVSDGSGNLISRHSGFYSFLACVLDSNGGQLKQSDLVVSKNATLFII